MSLNGGETNGVVLDNGDETDLGRDGVGGNPWHNPCHNSCHNPCDNSCDNFFTIPDKL